MNENKQIPEPLIPAKYMTAGELSKWLAQFPEDEQVVIEIPEGGEWLNISSVWAPSSDDETEDDPSRGKGYYCITINTVDDFDPRQF